MRIEEVETKRVERDETMIVKLTTYPPHLCQISKIYSL